MSPVSGGVCVYYSFLIASLSRSFFVSGAALPRVNPLAGVPPAVLRRSFIYVAQAGSFYFFCSLLLAFSLAI